MSILWVFFALIGRPLVVPSDLGFLAATCLMSALIASGGFPLLWVWIYRNSEHSRILRIVERKFPIALPVDLVVWLFLYG